MMLFDLETYLPLNVFVVIVLAIMGAIVAYGERRDNNRKDK